MSKLSKYYFKTKLDKDCYAIYNSLLLDILFVDNKTLYNVENFSLDKEDIQMVKKAGIYIDNEEEDEKLLKSITKDISSESIIDTIYIIPSSTCNLRCSYCMVYNNVGRNITKFKYMNYKVIDSFLKKYVDYAKQNNISEAMIIFMVVNR